MAPSEARLTAYALRSVEGYTDTAEALFLTRAVYGQPGQYRWHRGRVQLEDGRTVPAVVRDLSHAAAAADPAAAAWRKLEGNARRDGWLMGHLASLQLRGLVDRALADFNRATRAELADSPECTQDALRSLRKALGLVLGNPVALDWLDRGQATAYPLSEALRKSVPAGQGQGMLVVRARELAERLHKSANEAGKLHAPANRRGRKAQTAARRLALCLAAYFAQSSRRRATATPGGPFLRFVAGALAYHAAAGETPTPTLGPRVLTAALREYRNRYPPPGSL